MEVTVLMPTYNRERTVGRAIESFLAQDYDNSKLIVLNDGSTDNTGDVLNEYAGHPRITINHTHNNKPPRNWNLLWDKVNGADLICQLHDDDEMTTDSIYIRVNEFIKDPSLHVVYGGVIARSINNARYNFPGEPVDIERIWKEEYINFTTLMYRPNLPFRFDADMRYYCDWMFKIRCLQECKVGYVPDPVMIYSIHPGQESNRCISEGMNGPEEKMMRDKLYKLYDRR